MRQEGIVINPDRPPFGESATTTESWWLGLSPAEFYAEAHRRHPELARKYGSMPVTTTAPRDTSLGERFWRHKQNTREREERMAS